MAKPANRDPDPAIRVYEHRSGRAPRLRLLTPRKRLLLTVLVVILIGAFELAHNGSYDSLGVPSAARSRATSMSH